ncbi:Ig-like domain-containing protein [Sporosarcina sp. FSL K6-6792]|uniref:Ig-like domain-containing protein n=1 Tax=Sporosarcina sp. FSL K6-6792 TaxID=2921559 RepID=UPI0030FAAF45
MKKTFKVSAAAALAISALTPVAAFAAESTVAADGFYTNNSFVAGSDFRASTNPEKAAILKNPETVMVIGGKVYFAKDAILATTNAQLAEIVMTEADFEAQHGELTKNGYEVTPVTGELKVESVSAINAKEVTVNFSKAVDEDSVIDASGALIANTVSISAVGTATAPGTLTPELSEDGKTLTLTATNSFKGQYAVTVGTAIEDLDGDAIKAFTSLITVKDTTRPTVTGTEYAADGTATVTFSEPVDTSKFTSSEVILKDETGAVTGAITATIDATGKFFTINAGSIPANKEYTVTLIGVQDAVGNLISPNPVTFTLVNSVNDTVAPKVSSVVASKVGEMKITFSEKIKSTSGVVGTFDINAAGSATDIDLSVGGNATVDKTGTVVTVTDAGLTAGIKSITIDAFSDLAGNPGTAYTKLVEFVADTTAPKYVSHEVKTISNVQYLIVNYDEEVTPTNPAIAYSYVDEKQVTKSGSIASGSAVSAYDATDATATAAKAIKIDLTGLNVGKYEFSLPASLVADADSNISAAKVVTQQVGKAELTDKDAPELDSTWVAASAVNGNKVTLVFNENVTATTALNIANYTVEGEKVFKSAIFDGDEKTVVLTLKDSALSLDGDRYLTIKNVADLAGNVIEETNEVLTFVETVRPTVTSAEVTAEDEITVTFSETVANVNDADFEVFVGTSTTADTITVTGSAKTYVIKLSAPLSTLSTAVTLDIVEGNDIEDTNGNALATVGSVTVTK